MRSLRFLRSTAPGLTAFVLAALLSAACIDHAPPEPDPASPASAAPRAIAATAGLPTHSAAPSTPTAGETPRRAPQKWALLIGINEYASPEFVDLRGAVNDVALMNALLIGKFDFPPEQIRILLDEQATRAGILEAIETHLIANAQPGDIVVLHYSGHGSQMNDQTGAAADEADGRDETLVPHDSRVGDVFDISDDELNALLGALAARTDNATFILDSCHSGTGTRGGGMPRRAEPDPRPPPPPSALATRGAGSADDAPLRADDARYVLISGARADQLAREYVSDDGTPYGALTYFLTEELRHAPAGVTYRDVMDKVGAKVNSLYQRQEPQLEGARLDAHVFGDAESLAQPYIVAGPDASGGVVLDAGHVQGMTVGSTFDVYAPGTKRFDAAAPIARVRLTEVRGETAVAELLEGGPVPAAARAVERTHVFGDRQLLLHIDASDAPVLAEVRERLAPFTHIRLVDADGGYHLRLRHDDQALQLEGADGGDLGSPAVPLADPDPTGRVVEQIQGWARWFNVLSIENPSPSARVALRLEFETPEGGTRDPFRQPDPVSGEIREGQTFRIVVENLSDRAFFLNILDLSTDGSVSVIYPPQQGASERLAAGDTLVTRLLRFTVPDGRDAVRDVIKVFATPSPVDMRPLTQSGIRATLPQDPLGRLLAQAMKGAGTRGIEEAEPAIDLGAWATDQRAVRIVAAP